MKIIFKYTINYHSVPEIVRLPKGAEIIDFKIQDNAFRIWALIDPEAEEEARIFLLAMTGQGVEPEIIKTYGTEIIESNGIVMHLLELAPNTKAADPEKDGRLVKIKTND